MLCKQFILLWGPIFHQRRFLSKKEETRIAFLAPYLRALNASPISIFLLWPYQTDGLPRVVLSARAAAVGDGPHRCSSTGVDADETAAFRRIDDEEANYENDIRTQILDASLSFVIPNGWTQDSLALGKEPCRETTKP